MTRCDLPELVHSYNTKDLDIQVGDKVLTSVGEYIIFSTTDLGDYPIRSKEGVRWTRAGIYNLNINRHNITHVIKSHMVEGKEQWHHYNNLMHRQAQLYQGQQLTLPGFQPKSILTKPIITNLQINEKNAKVNKPIKKENQMRELVNEMKEVLNEFKPSFMTIVYLFLMDHFLLDGKLRNKLKELVDRALQPKTETK